MDQANGVPNSNLLHWMSILIVFISSVIGIALPFFIVKYKSVSNNNPFFINMKTFATGVILSTGIVHMFPDATHALAIALPNTTYPFAGLIAGISCILILMLDQLLEQLKAKYTSHVKISHNDSSSDIEISNQHHHHHCHDMGSLYTSPGFDTSGSSRKYVIAIILEFGIALHSVIIGLALGVMPYGSEFVAFLIAITIHQMFEGFALGATLVEANIKNLTHIIMMMVILTTTT